MIAAFVERAAREASGCCLRGMFRIRSNVAVHKICSIRLAPLPKLVITGLSSMNIAAGCLGDGSIRVGIHSNYCPSIMGVGASKKIEVIP